MDKKNLIIKLFKSLRGEKERENTYTIPYPLYSSDHPLYPTHLIHTGCVTPTPLTNYLFFVYQTIIKIYETSFCFFKAIFLLFKNYYQCFILTLNSQNFFLPLRNINIISVFLFYLTPIDFNYFIFQFIKFIILDK